MSMRTNGIVYRHAASLRHAKGRHCLNAFVACCFGGWTCAHGFPADSAAVRTVFSSMEAAAGFHWGASESQYLSGMQSHMRRFVSRQTVSDSARRLSRASGVFSGLLAAPSMILLSGTRAHWHWIAHVEKTRDGAAGYVSALDMSLAGSMAAGSDRPQAAYLPAGATAIFRQSMTLGGTQASQQLYRLGRDYPQAFAYLQRRLRGQGWQPDPLLSSLQNSAAWRKNDIRLVLVPIEGDSILYLRRSAALSSKRP